MGCFCLWMIGEDRNCGTSGCRRWKERFIMSSLIYSTQIVSFPSYSNAKQEIPCAQCLSAAGVSFRPATNLTDHISKVALGFALDLKLSTLDTETQRNGATFNAQYFTRALFRNCFIFRPKKKMLGLRRRRKPLPKIFLRSPPLDFTRTLHKSL